MANLERRMERFDEFFLFITSVLGLFFSLLYALLGYQEIAYAFIPLLLIGLVIPIYIGYVRGAILLDLLEERIRGWIYFLSGISVYIGLVILSAINKLLTIFGSEMKPFQTALYLGGTLFLGYYLGRGRLHNWFCKSVHKTFNQEITELAEKIYRDTSSSAYSMGIMFYVSLTLFISETFEPEPVFIFMVLFFVIMGVVDFVVGESGMRKWVNLVKFSEFIEIKSKVLTPHISRRVANSLLILFILILSFNAFVWESIPRAWSIAITVFTILPYVLLFLLTRTKYTPVRKKDVPKEIEPELTRLINHIKGKRKENKDQEKD